jgi:hypothetical protein
MRRLALVFAILVAVSASEHIAMSPRASGKITAFAARVMRMPVNLTGVSMASVNSNGAQVMADFDSRFAE